MRDDNLVEQVTVNGISMYRVESRLFLSKREAHRYAANLKRGDYIMADKIVDSRKPMNYKALIYGDIYPEIETDEELIARLIAHGKIKGILL